MAKMNFHLFDRLLSMDNICVPISSSVTTKKTDLRSTKYDKKFQQDGEVVDFKAISKKNYDCATNAINDIIEK